MRSLLKKWSAQIGRSSRALRARFPGSSGVVVALSVVSAIPMAGCTVHYIPNTDVEDTSENRKVIAFCEKYRHAIEDRNTALLMEMASPSYYEDGGNVDATDDMDYSGLQNYLDGRFRDTRAIRYEIRYRRIHGTSTGRVHVDFTYTASYKIPGLTGQDEWRHTVADNRLELLPEQEKESFRIVAGM